MGINDIFEPSRADFTPMTDEPGIYAKHVEQSITLNIRTQANNQLKRTSTNCHHKSPVVLSNVVIIGLPVVSLSRFGQFNGKIAYTLHIERESLSIYAVGGDHP